MVLEGTDVFWLRFMENGLPEFRADEEAIWSWAVPTARASSNTSPPASSMKTTACPM